MLGDGASVPISGEGTTITGDEEKSGFVSSVPAESEDEAGTVSIALAKAS